MTSHVEAKFKWARAIGLTIALSAGTAALAGCGSHHEGAGEVPILDCDNGLTKNKVTIGSFPKGKALFVGDRLYYDQKGEVSDGAEVTSLGQGDFSVKRGDTTITTKGSGANTFKQNDGDNPTQEVNLDGDTITFIDGEERFTISTDVASDSRAVSLIIDAACTDEN